MSRTGASFTIREFDGWGAVYATFENGERVYEGDAEACRKYVLEQTGVTIEPECGYLADNGFTAPDLQAARKHGGG